MKPNEVKLLHQLANMGIEKRPDEIPKMITDVTCLVEVVDEDCYRWLKNMTPGEMWVESCRRKIPCSEFLKLREIIIAVYEHQHKAENGTTEAWKERTLVALAAARKAAAAKRKSGRCVICRAGIDPTRRSLCAWCWSVEKARRETLVMLADTDFAKDGYQILGPSGGRLYTHRKDPGGRNYY